MFPFPASAIVTTGLVLRQDFSEGLPIWNPDAIMEPV